MHSKKLSTVNVVHFSSKDKLFTYSDSIIRQPFIHHIVFRVSLLPRFSTSRDSENPRDYRDSGNFDIFYDFQR